MRALITGANRGIGLGFVRQLAARGERVFATCRFPNEADELHALSRDHNGQISIHQLDITDVDSIAASVAAVSEETGALDLLINNGAITMPDGGLGHFDPAVMQTVLTVNAIAPMLVTEQYLPLLTEGEGSKIINISSGAGSITNRNSARSYSYGGSKAALNYFTRNLAHEVRDTGIIAIAMSPGWVRTKMGGQDAMIEVDESVAGMLRVIDGLSMDDTSEFFNYTGEHVAW